MATTEYAESTAYLQSLASAAKLSIENTSNRIWGLAANKGKKASLKETRFTHTVGDPDLGTAPKLTDFFSISDNADPALQKLNADADAWMAKYFPSMNECLKTLPEEWLCGVIGGTKPFGLDATVFEIVWHRARDRAYRAMATEQRIVETEFAARGFTIPPGAMVARMSEAVDKAGLAIAEVNREQAIKDAEIRLDILKFAEEQALNYKRGILAALADFMRQWIMLPDKDLERARVKAQATASLYSALSSFHNVELSYEELKMKAKQLAAEVDGDIDRNRIANLPDKDEADKAQALGQVARAFADIASQAANAAGTLVASIESV